jgi:hypothetical protein
MTTQVVRSLAAAVEQAIKWSTDLGYAVIILYKGEYYVETQHPLNAEEIIGEYENGELLNGY